MIKMHEEMNDNMVTRHDIGNKVEKQDVGIRVIKRIKKWGSRDGSLYPIFLYVIYCILNSI